MRLFGWELKLPIPPEQKIPLLLSLYWLAPLLLWGYVQYGEKGSLASYGVAWHLPFYRRVALGFALGVVSIISLFLIKQRLTWVQWQGLSQEENPSLPETGRWIRSLLSIGLPIGLLSLVISWVEELVFRGFVVNQLRLAYGWGP